MTMHIPVQLVDDTKQVTPVDHCQVLENRVRANRLQWYLFIYPSNPSIGNKMTLNDDDDDDDN